MTKSNEDNGEFYECMRLGMSCGTRPITHEKIKQTLIDETSREKSVQCTNCNAGDIIVLNYTEDNQQHAIEEE